MPPRAQIVAVLLLAASAGWAGAQSTQPAAAAGRAPSNLIHRSAAPTTAGSSPTSNQTGASGVRVFLSLAAVLGLITLLYWGSRRVMPAAAGAGRPTQAVQVLSRTRLSGKQKILLIQVGRRLLVVGDSGQQLNTLCEIDDAEEAAALIEQVSGASRNGSASASALSSAASRLRPAAAESGAGEANPDASPDLKTAQQELDGLVQRVRRIASHADRA